MRKDLWVGELTILGAPQTVHCSRESLMDVFATRRKIGEDGRVTTVPAAYVELRTDVDQKGHPLRTVEACVDDRSVFLASVAIRDLLGPEVSMTKALRLYGQANLAMENASLLVREQVENRTCEAVHDNPTAYAA